jgi:hypothetical protein
VLRFGLPTDPTSSYARILSMMIGNAISDGQNDAYQVRLPCSVRTRRRVQMLMTVSSPRLL